LDFSEDNYQRYKNTTKRFYGAKDVTYLHNNGWLPEYAVEPSIV
jgi:hypothetical protein